MSIFIPDLQHISGCPAMDQLILDSKTFSKSHPDMERYRLQWFPHFEFKSITPIQNPIDKFTHSGDLITITVSLMLLETNDKCTDEFIQEIARIYSLSTSRHGNYDHFKRFPIWLEKRNDYIYGFTNFEGNYYMVVCESFSRYYVQYGFCSVCGTLRCSPVWCICGHKELINAWTSNNEMVDEIIKHSQRQTVSANEAYLEWIPFDSFFYFQPFAYARPRAENSSNRLFARLLDLPCVTEVELVPFQASKYTGYSCYHKLCADHPGILDKNVWVIVGFTYDPKMQKYYLVKNSNPYKDELYGLCLACTDDLDPYIGAFCFNCKAPNPLDWTTGNKSLDLLIMKSWSNTVDKHDSYIRWIEFSHLTAIQEMPLLDYACTHAADCLGRLFAVSRENLVTIKVMLKKVVCGHDADSYDFNQLTKVYPNILSPHNIHIFGITRDPSLQDHYLVFYSNVRQVLDKLIQVINYRYELKFMEFAEFNELEEVGSGAYGTVYTANSTSLNKQVALKRFKNSNETPDLFISECKNYSKCCPDESFLKLYGITQQPETKEYVVVMQYANEGNLFSYMDRNINKMTWKMKARLLELIANQLNTIHFSSLIHCDLHGGNIILSKTTDNPELSTPYICDLALSIPKNSPESSVSDIKGVLPYVAPEVFRTRKFTQESDIYAFGMLMYVIATGEPPFRDRIFDEHLTRDICNGLRPKMPESVPERYRRLAEDCWNADPKKRPNTCLLGFASYMFTEGDDKEGWNTVYRNDVRPLSRLEKESKYSSRLLLAEICPNQENESDSY